MSRLSSLWPCVFGMVYLAFWLVYLVFGTRHYSVSMNYVSQRRHKGKSPKGPERGIRPQPLAFKKIATAQKMWIISCFTYFLHFSELFIQFERGKWQMISVISSWFILFPACVIGEVQSKTSKIFTYQSSEHKAFPWNIPIISIPVPTMQTCWLYVVMAIMSKPSFEMNMVMVMIFVLIMVIVAEKMLWCKNDDNHGED